tara:strand:+ start:1211 stop:1645 length:435 start_codon:yes stop_codon:yes gene_type:complete
MKDVIDSTWVQVRHSNGRAGYYSSSPAVVPDICSTAIYSMSESGTLKNAPIDALHAIFSTLVAHWAVLNKQLESELHEIASAQRAVDGLRTALRSVRGELSEIEALLISEGVADMRWTYTDDYPDIAESFGEREIRDCNVRLRP